MVKFRLRDSHDGFLKKKLCSGDINNLYVFGKSTYNPNASKYIERSISNFKFEGIFAKTRNNKKIITL